MATIVEPPKPKRVTCQDCEAVIEYLPEEVREESRTDYTGDTDIIKYVKCPRSGCPGRGVIRRT